MVLTVQLEKGKKLEDFKTQEVKFNGTVVGKITTYDEETGVATMEIHEEHIDTIKEIVLKQPIIAISSRGKKPKKDKLKPEHKKIINAITKYLERNPQIRFGQALFNLNINEFADRNHPELKNHLLRDIHSDSDEKIVKRLPKRAI